MEMPVALQYQKKNPELIVINDKILNNEVAGSAVGIKKDKKIYSLKLTKQFQD